MSNISSNATTYHLDHVKRLAVADKNAILCEINIKSTLSEHVLQFTFEMIQR